MFTSLVIFEDNLELKRVDHRFHLTAKESETLQLLVKGFSVK
jgi:hypothetical protein